jgi:hypothetical protein
MIWFHCDKEQKGIAVNSVKLPTILSLKKTICKKLLFSLFKGRKPEDIVLWTDRRLTEPLADDDPVQVLEDDQSLFVGMVDMKVGGSPHAPPLLSPRLTEEPSRRLSRSASQKSSTMLCRSHTAISHSWAKTVLCSKGQGIFLCRRPLPTAPCRSRTRRGW